MDIAFSANMKKLFVVPHNVNFTYSHNSSAPNIYTAKLRYYNHFLPTILV